MTRKEPTPLNVAFAAATRPHPAEHVNGDAWRVWAPDAGRHTYRVAVVDGLGHGPLAAAAAAAALASLDATRAESLSEALLRCHTALRGTRGAAVSLAEIDVTRAELDFVGVGNVEARVWPAGASQRAERPLVYRGVVGAAVPRVRAFTLPLPTDWRLVIHTDGVSARFNQADLPRDDDAQSLADLILDRWSRPTDDATVVVCSPLPLGDG
ncbi:MAG TPA: SpoIIE family protein phosphatase [Chloroflexota bacterium]|nr:SpoIIE family protein phosphatase [Chloroflexota bacterium]